MEIHVMLTGRMGNQLFQYSFAKVLQKRYGGNIYLNTYDLDVYSIKAKHIPGKFQYDLKNFKLDSDVILECVKPKGLKNERNLFNRLFRKFLPKLFFKFMAKKGNLIWLKNSYIKIPDLKCDKIFVFGWWQNNQYYEDIQDVLREQIQPISAIKDSYSYYNVSNENDLVCISIRGGNYFAPNVKKKLYVCNPNYFYNCIKEMLLLVEKPVFLICTDDLNWVKNDIQFEKHFPDCKFIYESGNNTIEEKLKIMSTCKHFIISNSTFSWWGQYLSNNKNKIVLAPSKWFVNGNKIDLYQNFWKLIEV